MFLKKYFKVFTFEPVNRPNYSFFNGGLGKGAFKGIISLDEMFLTCIGSIRIIKSRKDRCMYSSLQI